MDGMPLRGSWMPGDGCNIEKHENRFADRNSLEGDLGRQLENGYRKDIAMQTDAKVQNRLGLRRKMSWTGRGVFPYFPRNDTGNEKNQC